MDGDGGTRRRRVGQGDWTLELQCGPSGRNCDEGSHHARVQPSGVPPVLPAGHPHQGVRRPQRAGHRVLSARHRSGGRRRCQDLRAPRAHRDWCQVRRVCCAGGHRLPSGTEDPDLPQVGPGSPPCRKSPVCRHRAHRGRPRRDCQARDGEARSKWLGGETGRAQRPQRAEGSPPRQLPVQGGRPSRGPLAKKCIPICACSGHGFLGLMI
mmetsp:Transcript_4997/g.12944  ORF Transcript_4997/g.12944 Transcript_4997/m.12944 type:complete len:210 (-) Transcript_4997:1878-2507(-)